MNANMRRRLERSLDYHAALVTHHSGRLAEARKAETAEAPPEEQTTGNGGQTVEPRRRARAASSAQNGNQTEEARTAQEAEVTAAAVADADQPEVEVPRHPDELLAEINEEVVRQLREVLDATPLVPAVQQVREDESRPTRNIRAR